MFSLNGTRRLDIALSSAAVGGYAFPGVSGIASASAELCLQWNAFALGGLRVVPSGNATFCHFVRCSGSTAAYIFFGGGEGWGVPEAPLMLYLNIYKEHNFLRKASFYLFVYVPRYYNFARGSYDFLYSPLLS